MLSNKLALVTGAASGIGFAAAQLFAKEGATVIAIDFSETVHEVVKDFEPSKNQTQHSSFTCDISNGQQVNDLFKKIKEAYPVQKVPTIILNSAGISRLMPFLQATEDHLDEVMNTNFKGTFLVTQAACKELVANYDESKLFGTNSYASIINLSSIAAIKTVEDNFAYCVSKAAVESLTRSTAREMGMYKIRCNTIAPQYARTPMIMNSPVASILHKITAITPLKRIAEPSEIADTCLFLASDRSSYMSGAYLKLDGGLTC